jgi:hypothetical protein
VPTLGSCSLATQALKTVKRTSKPTGGSRRRSRAARDPVASVLAAFAKVARRRRVPWYVFGAQAVACYGVMRMSADVDITVLLGAGEVDEFCRDLKKADFRLRVTDAGFVRETRVLPVEHVGTGWPVDIVLAGPGLEEDFLDRVRRKRVSGVTVPVIAPEDLIVTKLLAGRPKDLEDVRNLVAAPGLEIDLAGTRRVLADVEAALGQSDLLPVFERIVAG